MTPDTGVGVLGPHGGVDRPLVVRTLEEDLDAGVVGRLGTVGRISDDAAGQPHLALELDRREELDHVLHETSGACALALLGTRRWRSSSPGFGRREATDDAGHGRLAHVALVEIAGRGARLSHVGLDVLLSAS